MKINHIVVIMTELTRELIISNTAI